MSLSTIPEVLEALRAGKPVIVADDEGRENEGDAIMAAEFATQEWIAWMVRSSGMSAPISMPICSGSSSVGSLKGNWSISQSPRCTAFERPRPYRSTSSA